MKKGGYTLVEVILTLAILSIVTLVMLTAFTAAHRGVVQAKNKMIGITVASEIQERIRNMPYDDIGTTTGWPSGTIEASQTITRTSVNFDVAVRVDYIDDPFDGDALGTIPLKPVDTVPTDFKRVEVTVLWEGANNGVVMTSRYAPNGLETATNSGSLFITVFDASGQPVPLADVTVINNVVNPNILIENTTDINGKLQLLSLPPSIESYNITISKTGYSTDGTVPISVPNPEPTKGDVSIIVQEVTEISFSIDQVSTLDIYTVDTTCVPFGAISFNLQGTKQIGDNPVIYKYDVDHSTDVNGNVFIENLEWDNYFFTLNTSDYDIGGFTPPNALQVLPGVYTNLSIILYPHQLSSLFLTVVDSGTEVPITGASVQLTATGYDQTLVTGEGYLEQTDWSGGSGQTDIGDPTMFFTDNGSIDSVTTSGQIVLSSSQVVNSFLDTFVTDANKDAITTTADWDTGAGIVRLSQTAGSYDSSAIAQSITLNAQPELITTATLIATDQLNGETITYYMAADGVSFEQVTSGVEHTFVSPGDDLRFRILLETIDPLVTPEVSQVQVQATTLLYDVSGNLESSTFNLGAAGTFSTLDWDPSTQIADVGIDAVRFQIATNSDNATWNFIGPDGTNGTYYSAPNVQLATVHDGDQYLRYKVYLQTANSAYSPVLSHTAIGFTSSCTPPGQVFFNDVSNETYGIDITHPSYETYSSGIDVSGNSEQTIMLTPL